MEKKVVVVGAGEVGSFLGSLLEQWGHAAVLIDRQPETLERLTPTLGKGKVRLVLGDATEPQVLELAELGPGDTLVAVTGSDPVNLTVSSLARFQFQALRTLARVNVPRHAWMFTKELGVDVALNQAEVLAHLVAEQASTGDMLTLLKLGGGGYSLVEAEVGPRSSALGRPLTELNLPEECILVGVLRQRELMLPRGQTVLQAGDQVLALTHQDHRDGLRDLLEGHRR